ncbi:multidrug resistance-associated protein 4-like [Diabrotica virgifera virgifera]|nr:multidrug resistance-associated protein 4-like [Diabrotica virgifera virgifera]
MYTWEDYFLGKVDTARKLEIKKMLSLLYMRIAVETSGLLVSKLGFYLLVMTYIWVNDEAEATTVFFIMSNYGTISYTLGILIPDGITTTYEFLSTTTRLNSVLQAKELPIPKIKDKTSRPTIHIKDASISLGKENILNNITLKVTPGLTLVTGQVGSGKSSLLKLMLQSYPLNTGDVSVEGRISYASQDPWLFPSSVKQNILFGEDLDPKRYAEVLRICALEFDLKLLEKGDETILIDKGSNLSKGQQARINLARAVYRISDIYLLDDCLTALDNEVQDYIFKECIQTFLKGKICVLVTQTERHMKQSDIVVIMKNGEIFKTTRPTNQSLKEIKDINTLQNDDVKEKEMVENDNRENKKLLEAEQTVEQRKKVYEETIQKGSVSYKNYKKYFGFGGFALMVIYCIVCGGFQFATSYSDKLLTKWVDDQQHVINFKAKLMQFNISSLDPYQNESFTLLTNGKALKDEIKDFNFTNNNNFTKINKSKNVNTHNNNLTKENIIQGFDKAQEKAKNTFKWYYIMLFSGAVMDIIKTGIIYDICRRASINLHYTLVKNILNAVMHFFDTHFIGNILNRLSQDLVMMDERLGYILNESFGVIYMMCGTAILIVSVNKLFIFYTVFIITCLMALGRIYLPFNRNMKRLEASTRSPMIGHLNATLEGITTVRAYKAENILTDEFDRHHDLFTSTYYTRTVFHRAYGFCATFLSTTLVTMLILTFIFIDTGASAGNVGLALQQAFLLGSFIASAVNVYTDLETMMTSVERVFEYTDIETEKQDGTLVTGWPKEGSISYEYVSLTYNKTDHILKNVSFEVKSNEKIGIIGRTGAGKSSLISTIFRLYGIHGKILIDKIDIKTLPLKILRKNIAIIPQDPVLFSGTIRSNLDPFNKFNDEELWSAIDKANLKSFILDLDSKIIASSSSLSLGQKQMFCVARAIISNAKIIVLDEATANMDNETQTLVNKSIRDNFSGCTVLTIAHRLENIIESDKILVMDRGEVREYANPEQLLKNKESYFSKMVQKTLNY